MKHIILFIFAAMTLILSSSQCKKGGEEFGPEDTYFRCKINGQTYIPNNCANCLSFMVLEDTSLIANANAGFVTIGFGINDSSNIQIKKYQLVNKGGMRATYKNSITTDDYYRTQDFSPGYLIITDLDKENKIIKGTFNFTAYHSYRPNDSVVVSNGIFRVKYTTY